MFCQELLYQLYSNRDFIQSLVIYFIIYQMFHEKSDQITSGLLLAASAFVNLTLLGSQPNHQNPDLKQ